MVAFLMKSSIGSQAKVLGGPLALPGAADFSVADTGEKSYAERTFALTRQNPWLWLMESGLLGRLVSLSTPTWWPREMAGQAARL
jgi:hypothetical protein